MYKRASRLTDSIKFDIDFYEKLHRKSSTCLSRTKISGALHEVLSVFRVTDNDVRSATIN